MQFEVDEYGRVRHYGVPDAGQKAQSLLEPRRVVQDSKFDPLYGVAHREYRKHDPALLARDSLELRVDVNEEARQGRGGEEWGGGGAQQGHKDPPPHTHTNTVGSPLSPRWRARPGGRKTKRLCANLMEA